MRALRVLTLLLTSALFVGNVDAEDTVIDEGPQTIAELAPAAIADELNAAWHLEQLRVPAEAFTQRQQEFLDSPLGVECRAREDRGEEPTAEQMAGMAEVVQRFSMLDEGAAAVAACEQYASRADFSGDSEKFTNSLLHQITAARGVARYLDWRIRTLAAAGDTEGAMRRAIDLLRISRLVQNEPTLVGYLSGIAKRGVAINGLEKVLSASRVAFSTRTTLDTELASIDDPRKFASMLRNERAYAMAVYEEQLKNRDEDDVQLLAGAVGLAWTKEQQLRGLRDYLDAVIVANERTWYEFDHEMRFVLHHLRVAEDYGPLAAEMSPMVLAAVESHERDLARVRSLRIVNSLAIFAVMNKREATGVGELDLPGSALIDSYSGALLKVKHKDAGWIVYSIGNDGQDNDGAFTNFIDVGVGPIKVVEMP